MFSLPTINNRIWSIMASIAEVDKAIPDIQRKSQEIINKAISYLCYPAPRRILPDPKNSSTIEICESLDKEYRPVDNEWENAVNHRSEQNRRLFRAHNERTDGIITVTKIVSCCSAVYSGGKCIQAYRANQIVKSYFWGAGCIASIGVTIATRLSEGNSEYWRGQHSVQALGQLHGTAIATGIFGIGIFGVEADKALLERNWIKATVYGTLTLTSVMLTMVAANLPNLQE